MLAVFDRFRVIEKPNNLSELVEVGVSHCQLPRGSQCKFELHPHLL